MGVVVRVKMDGSVGVVVVVVVVVFVCEM